MERLLNPDTGVEVCLCIASDRVGDVDQPDRIGVEGLRGWWNCWRPQSRPGPEAGEDATGVRQELV